MSRLGAALFHELRRATKKLRIAPPQSGYTQLVSHLQSKADLTIMFDQAESFDQNLGWCMQSDVQMDDHSEGWTPFDGTPCFDARCGVHVKGVDC